MGRNMSLVVACGQTDVGKTRSNNEDCFKVLVGKEAPKSIDALMVVADGMGGHAAGEVASAMTVDGMVRHLTIRALEATTPGEDYSHLLGQILIEVNREVRLAGRNPERRGMGTTCTAAVLKDNQVHVAHVGDSRGYILRGGRLVQITKDHSWVAQQVEEGNLTPEQADNHPYRNVVTRAIGIDENVKIDTLVKSVATGDRVMLCSDGLNSVVGNSEIEATLKSGDVKSACESLIALANANGGPDNITVTVAETVSLD
ncbi:MAG: Stp1/IreP family PP2C-type Ser/Thr phosphatase [SAR202 cluster bacterium]|nr:Stp1/IreP family PP2C-type Ser/Thr phosphatase [SAR202 cluster bacterium]